MHFVARRGMHINMNLCVLCIVCCICHCIAVGRWMLAIFTRARNHISHFTMRDTTKKKKRTTMQRRMQRMVERTTRWIWFFLSWNVFSHVNLLFLPFTSYTNARINVCVNEITMEIELIVFLCMCLRHFSLICLRRSVLLFLEHCHSHDLFT